jgi:phosphatidylinositol alpha-1,6-mannosyltransferase
VSQLCIGSPFETLHEIHPLNVQMLLSDGFGGFGGISRFNRDFLSALNICSLVERVYALPRIISDQIDETIPEAVVYERRAARGRLFYALAVARRARLGPRADLVICGHINLLPLAWVAAWLAHARLALIVHGYEAWAPSSHRLSNLLVNRIDAFIAVSRFSAQRFVQWSNVPAARGYILPNCVDLDQFQPRERDLELVNRYGLRSAIVMLTVARLATNERYKGIDEIIGVMPRLLQQLPNLRYLIVGDGSDRARLEAKVRAHGLSNYIIFAGRIAEAEKVAHYNLADVFVMPSHGEGFGIALIEAAACGIPVVGSSVDGSCDALLDGQLGRLVDPNNPDELTRAISAVINTPKPRTRSPQVETFDVGRFQARVAEWLTQQAGTIVETKSTP